MKALQGKDHHVFLHNDGNHVLAYLTGNRKLSPQFLNEFKQKQITIYRTLHNNKIDYIFCPIPDKAEIYPQSLPDTYKIKRPTPLDVIFTLLAPIPTFDIRPHFLQKPDVYYHYCDTHLNFNGVYTCYYNLIQHLRIKYPQIPGPTLISSLQLEPNIEKPSDLLNWATTIDLNSLAQKVNTSVYVRNPLPHYDTIGLSLEDEWQKFLDRYFQFVNFNPADYLLLNVDMAAHFNQSNCLRHYIVNGFSERRKFSTKPVISLEQYLSVDLLVKAPPQPNLPTLEHVRKIFHTYFIQSVHARNLFLVIFQEAGDYYYQAYCSDLHHYHLTIDSQIQVTSTRVNDKPFTRYINPNSSLPSVVVCHDSYFFSYMGPLLSTHFSKCVFIWNHDPFPVDLILAEMPTLVIHEVAGRFIVG